MCWGAHARRVLAIAPSGPRIFLHMLHFDQEGALFGGTPLQRTRSDDQPFKCAREAHALGGSRSVMLLNFSTHSV